jgi:pyrroloquinoline quinone (PQQ) biosynthesis protein C
MQGFSEEERLDLLVEKIAKLEASSGNALSYYVDFTSDLENRLLARQEELCEGVDLLYNKIDYLIAQVQCLHDRLNSDFLDG